MHGQERKARAPLGLGCEDEVDAAGVEQKSSLNAPALWLCASVLSAPTCGVLLDAPYCNFSGAATCTARHEGKHLCR